MLIQGRVELCDGGGGRRCCADELKHTLYCADSVGTDRRDLGELRRWLTESNVDPFSCRHNVSPLCLFDAPSLLIRPHFSPSIVRLQHSMSHLYYAVRPKKATDRRLSVHLNVQKPGIMDRKVVGRRSRVRVGQVACRRSHKVRRDWV